MARKLRIEVEGGLYHVITRGNDRQDVFHSNDDHRKFLSLLALQKQRTPYFLYAYCLMTNHVHLLIERQADTIVAGKDAGATITELSGIVDLDVSTVSRRSDAARQNLEIDSKLVFAKSLVKEKYHARIAELHV